jgi:hypothetical protein
MQAKSCLSDHLNEDPYLVEFIRAERRDEATKPDLKITAADGDLEPAPIEGLNWLINAPKFEEIVMGVDGRPVLLCCIDPRAFALHKLWLSKRSSRDGLKRERDAMQARAVAAVATQLMGLQFDRRDLTALPKELAEGAQELAKATIDLRKLRRPGPADRRAGLPARNSWWCVPRLAPWPGARG